MSKGAEKDDKSSPNRSSKDILNSLQSKMNKVKQIPMALKSGPTVNKTMNLANLLIWSRIVINETENLRSIDRTKFEKWYAPYRMNLFGIHGSIDPDPLLNYFIEARNELEHRGTLNVRRVTNIKHLTLPQDALKYGPPPPGAKSFFIGDELGGSGWIVESADGEKTKFYVEFSRDQVETSLLPHTHPAKHLGEDVKGKSIEELAEMYVRYLNRMVQSALSEFKE